MALPSNGDDDGITSINVTPLVDITLVLLIIFMVTAKLMVDPQLPVKLPNAETGEQRPPAPLTVVIEKSGALIVDGAPMNEARLRDLARMRKVGHPDLNVLIAADLSTQHGRVVRVMDLLRREGISQFGISVAAEELGRN
jgi:biopolymer transport protein ExbD